MTTHEYDPTGQPTMMEGSRMVMQCPIPNSTSPDALSLAVIMYHVERMHRALSYATAGIYADHPEHHINLGATYASICDAVSELADSNDTTISDVLDIRSSLR